MLANAARASRALDDDAHEISTRRLAYWRRAHRRAQKTNVGAASGKTDLNHISYFHRFHTSLNTMMRDDFDHHRGTRSTQESRLSKFPILEGKAYMFSQGLMQIIQYYKIFNGTKLP